MNKCCKQTSDGKFEVMESEEIKKVLKKSARWCGNCTDKDTFLMCCECVRIETNKRILKVLADIEDASEACTYIDGTNSKELEKQVFIVDEDYFSELVGEFT